MAIDLLFSQTPATSGALVFGDDTAGPVSKDASVAFSAELPGLDGTVLVAVEAPSVSIESSLPELAGTVVLVAQGVSTLSVGGGLPGLSGGVSLTVNGTSSLMVSGSLPALSGVVPFTIKLPTLLLLAGSLPGLNGTVLLSAVDPLRLTITGTFPGLTGAIEARYDSRTERPEVCDLRGVFQRGKSVETGVDSRYHAGIAVYASVESVWQQAAQLIASVQSSWREGDRSLRPLLVGRYQEAEALRTGSVSSRFQDGQRYQVATEGRFEQGIRVSNGMTSSWQDAYRDRRLSTVARYEEGMRLSSSLMSSAAAGLRLSANFGGRYQHAMRPPAGIWVRPLPPIPGNPCYTPSGALLFDAPWSAVMEMVFICERHSLPPAPGAAVVVPVLRTYVTINSITLRRVDGNVPIPTHAFGMSLDTDSWTWSWNASIPLAALPLVQPGSDGAPVEVEALVNGVPYRLYAEGIASQRQFAQGRIAVKGRGLAALLDAPYASVKNHGNAAARTAQQLMTDVLSVNGVGFGWAVDWALTDWLVPGNTWTHQGAYIAAILDIAKAAGGYVQPHDTDQTLRILPRYPAAPWDWASVTPDFELPSAVVSVEGIDWARKADYDRVFVSGTQNGVLGQVTRAGTAGASVAPMVTDSLITHAAAARQRGLAILSDTGRQARVTLTLPVLAETGLIKPGQFVRYQDGADSRLGLVRSTSLAWSRPKLRQTIAVETHA